MTDTNQEVREPFDGKRIVVLPVLATQGKDWALCFDEPGHPIIAISPGVAGFKRFPDRDRARFDALAALASAPPPAVPDAVGVRVTSAMVTAFYEKTEVTREGSILGIKEGLAAAIALSSIERTPSATGGDAVRVKEAAVSIAQMVDDWYRPHVAADLADIPSPLIENRLRRFSSIEPTPSPSPSWHGDDISVDRFAVAMKAKLAMKRKQGYGGWYDETACSQEFLSEELRRHALKSDPIDVANFAMFLHQRGETIAEAPSPEPQAAEALADMERRKDAAYEERNKVVAALAKLFPSGICKTDIPGWSDDWHGCVRIDLPTGQVSWHYHDSQAHLFADLPPYQGEWDGHDTQEKYRRLAALSSEPQASNAGAVEALEAYYARQIEWSRKTFGPALRTGGVIDHIRKELREIEASPHDLSEWVDVIILSMDGFWRHGGTATGLMPALLAKQVKNMARDWPDWRTMSENVAIEHDRSGEPAVLSTPEPQTGERDGEVVAWGAETDGFWELCNDEDTARRRHEPARKVEPLVRQSALLAERTAHEAAERRVAEVKERAREDERDRLLSLAFDHTISTHPYSWKSWAEGAKCWLKDNGAMFPSERAALRAKPEAQAIVGKEGDQ